MSRDGWVGKSRCILALGATMQSGSLQVDALSQTPDTPNETSCILPTVSMVVPCFG